MHSLGIRLLAALAKGSALVSLTSRNSELIVPDGTRYELLGGHTSVELKAQMLRSAVHLGNGEQEFNLLPSRNRSHHHLALTDDYSRRADTANAPNETPPPNDLALILALEAICPRPQQERLSNGGEFDAPRPQLDQQRPMACLVGALSDVDGYTPACGHAPVER